MVLYDTTNTYQSIIHELWDLCDANITSMPLATAVRRINASYEELIGEIINADGTWQWDDDVNIGDAPRGKGDLVEGQEYYTFASKYLQVEAVDIKGTDGIYRRIKPIDPKEFEHISPDEYFGIDASGNPETSFPDFYDIKGNSIRLYPAPTATEVTLTEGLRISFKRTADLFTTSDTSQSPELPSTHHVLLAFMAAVPFCMSYKKDRVPLYEKKVDSMKKTLLEHYSYREKNRRGIIIPSRRAYK